MLCCAIPHVSKADTNAWLGSGGDVLLLTLCVLAAFCDITTGWKMDFSVKFSGRLFSRKTLALCGDQSLCSVQWTCDISVRISNYPNFKTISRVSSDQRWLFSKALKRESSGSAGSGHIRGFSEAAMCLDSPLCWSLKTQNTHTHRYSHLSQLFISHSVSARRIKDSFPCSQRCAGRWLSFTLMARPLTSSLARRQTKSLFNSRVNVLETIPSSSSSFGIFFLHLSRNSSHVWDFFFPLFFFPGLTGLPQGCCSPQHLIFSL